MFNSLKTTSISMLATAILSGCGGGTSDCTDGGVKDTVVSIISNEVQKAQWGKEMFAKGLVEDLKVTRIKTTDYNEKLDRYICEASFSFTFKGNEQSKDIQYVNSYLEEEGETEVAVYGADDVKGLMLGLAMMGG
jgi:hypothetical protein